VIKSAYNYNTKRYDFSPIFRLVKNHLSNSDITIGNFEVTTAGKKYPYLGYPSFNTPDSVLSTLKNCGFDLLFTANNHCLDYGFKGLQRTIRQIKKHGINNTGTSNNPNKRFVIKQIKGIKIGFMAYVYGINGWENLKKRNLLSRYINIINPKHIKQNINHAKKMGCEYVIVSLHWGTEYQQEITPKQQKLVQSMFAWGADIILGSHPHVIQKAERYTYGGRDKYVIYSMGNFISNMSEKTVGNSLTEDGVLVKIKLRRLRTSGNIIIERIHYIPTWVKRINIGKNFKFTIIPIADFLKKPNLKKKLRLRLIRSHQDTMGMIIH